MPRPPHVDLGPLPVDLIEDLFGHELEPGGVVLTQAALDHVKRSHPKDWARCLPFVRRVVAEPTYIGDDTKNRAKVEFVGRMPGGEGLLVAVVIEMRRGCYHVASFYPVSQAKIDNRRRSGLLRNVVRK